MKNKKQSSERMASLAGKVLEQKTSTKVAKELAASVLSQAPLRNKKKK